MIRKLEGHHHDVVACDFSPDGALLATASYDTRVYIWDPHTGAILMEFGWVQLVLFQSIILLYCQCSVRSPRVDQNH